MFPTNKLLEKYGIVRSVLYGRLKALNIKPIRQGKRTYITDDQLQLMDDLHAHLKSGRTKEEFVQQCQASGRIVVLEKPAVESAISTAIVHKNEIQMTASQHQVSAQPTTKETEIGSEASRQNEIENLQVQKRKQVRLKDIQ